MNVAASLRFALVGLVILAASSCGGGSSGASHAMRVCRGLLDQVPAASPGEVEIKLGSPDYDTSVHGARILQYPGAQFSFTDGGLVSCLTPP